MKKKDRFETEIELKKFGGVRPKVCLDNKIHTILGVGYRAGFDNIHLFLSYKHGEKYYVNFDEIMGREDVTTHEDPVDKGFKWPMLHPGLFNPEGRYKPLLWAPVKEEEFLEAFNKRDEDPTNHYMNQFVSGDYLYSAGDPIVDESDMNLSLKRASIKGFTFEALRESVKNI